MENNPKLINVGPTFISDYRAYLVHHMSPINSESTNPEFDFTKRFVCLLFCNVDINNNNCEKNQNLT